MWNCIVCKKENPDDIKQCQCGYDRSIDYEQYRSFVKLNRHDIQKYQKMKTAAYNAIKPKAEVSKPKVEVSKPAESKPEVEVSKPAESKPKAKVSKPAEGKPKAEVSKPTESKPKVETSKPVESKPKVEANKSAQSKSKVKTSNPAESKPKVEVNKSETNKPKAQVNKSEDNKSKAATETVLPVLLEKTILPKTKLDWLILVIGAVMLYKAVWPDNVPSGWYFTTEAFWVPVGRFFDSLEWNAIIFILSMSYCLMYKSLADIQYDKKKQWIIVYVISSILPLCFFGDIVWGGVLYLLEDAKNVWEIVTVENMLASWFGLQVIIVLLALVEDPAKVVAKRKARKMSILPQTKLQTLILIMGVVLAVIFVNRENWYYTNVDIENIYMWESLLIVWILLYWLGKRLCYTFKFFKVMSYTCFSTLPLAVISDVLCSSDILRPYMGSDGTIWVLVFFASWILVIGMAIKEKQMK